MDGNNNNTYQQYPRKLRKHSGMSGSGECMTHQYVALLKGLCILQQCWEYEEEFLML